MIVPFGFPQGNKGTNLTKFTPTPFVTNMSYALPSRFKWLNSFYDFIPWVYIQRYVCRSATNGKYTNKYAGKSKLVKRGNAKRATSASSFLLAPLPPKLALTTDSRGFFDKLLNFPRRGLFHQLTALAANFSSQQ